MSPHRPDSIKRLSMTLHEKCMQEREKLRLRTTKSLKGDMWTLYTHAFGADLTVKGREGSFKVHSPIVRQRMPLLMNDITPDHMIINLPGASLEDAKELFRLIYMTDDISLATEMAAGYLNNNPESGTVLPETAPNVDAEEITVRDAVTPDLVHGLPHNADSVEDLRDIQSPSSETPIGSSSSYPPTPVDEPPAQFAYVPAYLVGAPDVPHLPSCGLGLDLLRLFLYSPDTDVAIRIDDKVFKGHKCILTTRCNYFDVMLSGDWVESSTHMIKLEGINPDAFYQALLFLYGGVIDLDVDCNVQDLLILADMYGMEGLKDVITFELKKNYCHFFHKPCSECIQKVPDALSLTYSYGMGELLQRILRWCDKYFLKVWPTKQFAGLPQEILDKCCDTISADLTKDSVIDVIFDCDKLTGLLPLVKWAEPIDELTVRLMDACVVYLQNNLFEVLESKTFSELGKNMVWSLNYLEEVITTTVKQMPHAVSCKTFMSAYRLCERAESPDCPWNDDFKTFIRTLTEKCRQNIRNNISHLEFTPEFEQLPQDEQKTIKEGSTFMSMGGSRAQRQKPQLSSQRGTTSATSGTTPPKSAVGRAQQTVARTSARPNSTSDTVTTRKQTKSAPASRLNVTAGSVGRPTRSPNKSVEVASTKTKKPDPKSAASGGSEKTFPLQESAPQAGSSGPKKPAQTRGATASAAGAPSGKKLAVAQRSKTVATSASKTSFKRPSSAPVPTKTDNKKSGSPGLAKTASKPGCTPASGSGAKPKKPLTGPARPSSAPADRCKKTPSKDSGVSSVGSSVPAMARPKRPQPSQPVLAPYRKTVSAVDISKMKVPLAQSTPMPRPSKLRKPQVHSPIKEKPAGALFPGSSATKQRSARPPEQKSASGQPGAGGLSRPKPPSITVKLAPADQTHKSHLPVRSPVRKTAARSLSPRQPTPRELVSPSKSLPCSPGRNQSVIPVPTSRSGKTAQPPSRTRRRLSDILPLPANRPLSKNSRSLSRSDRWINEHVCEDPSKNWCTLCRGFVKHDKDYKPEVLMPDAVVFSDVLMAEKTIDVSMSME